MKRMLFSMFAVLIIFSACNNQSASHTENESTSVNAEEVITIALKDFDTKAGEVVGKQVAIEGTVDHVCKHGGQKLFIVSEDSDTRVKVVTGENMAAFNTELEGESLSVVGLVDELRIDEEYLREWEEELKSGIQEENENEAMHAGEQKGDPHDDSGDHHDTDISKEMNQINNLRQQIAESEKDYLSFFSVVCIDYEVKPKEESEGV